MGTLIMKQQCYLRCNILTAARVPCVFLKQVTGTMTELVKQGYLTPRQLVEKMSYNPAKVLGIDKGTLREGAIADIVIANPDEVYTIDKETFVSKGKNTPFHGKEVVGKVLYTIVDGDIVFRA